MNHICTKSTRQTSRIYTDDNQSVTRGNGSCQNEMKLAHEHKRTYIQAQGHVTPPPGTEQWEGAIPVFSDLCHTFVPFFVAHAKNS